MKWNDCNELKLLCVLIILSKSLQIWVFMYRIGKQLYDHTNNGVESQKQNIQIQFSKLFMQLIDVKASAFACGDVCANADKTVE